MFVRRRPLLRAAVVGGGAYADHAGVSTQGQHNIERAKVSNAEGNELLLPIVYLFRGLVPDSGGAGEHRGGDTLGLPLGNPARPGSAARDGDSRRSAVSPHLRICARPVRYR